MLIYARNQTFCSKSVNKAPKILIFGLSILCGILSNYTWKNASIKINFLCILLFYEFIMFFFFSGEICGRHFLKHNNAKTNSFQPLRVKISIFIWTMWKTQFALILYTKSQFGAIFGPTCMYQKLRNYPRASQIWCQNVRETRKKKVIKCRGESFACCRVITRNVDGGGPFRPPPPPPPSF